MASKHPINWTTWPLQWEFPLFCVSTFWVLIFRCNYFVFQFVLCQVFFLSAFSECSISKIPKKMLRCDIRNCLDWIMSERYCTCLIQNKLFYLRIPYVCNSLSVTPSIYDLFISQLHHDFCMANCILLGNFAVLFGNFKFQTVIWNLKRKSKKLKTQKMITFLPLYSRFQNCLKILSPVNTHRHIYKPFHKRRFHQAVFKISQCASFVEFCI